LKRLIYEKNIRNTDKICLVITSNDLKDIKEVEGLINTESLSIKDLEKRFE